MSDILFAALSTRRTCRRGLTIIEMLIAIAITLLLMGAVASIFANVSNSVSKRRSAIEMSTHLSQARITLASDLEGMTCVTLPWQRPESSQGYFEIIEGLHSDFYPSMLTDGDTNNGELLPGSSTVPLGLQPGDDTSGAYVQNFGNPTATASNGLGDWDDVLAFTTRNEKEPFVGRAPSENVDPNDNSQIAYNQWRYATLQSPLAEVIWYAVENPSYDTGGLLAEAGFRTVYRRVLIIAPWIDFNYGNVSRPGVLRILTGRDANEPTAVRAALAALISFQERYDISAHIEFDRTIDPDEGGTWIIKANTLADLTKREHRYEHHGLVSSGTDPQRAFPFHMVNAGQSESTGSINFVPDVEFSNGMNAAWRPVLDPQATGTIQGYEPQGPGENYRGRPLAHTNASATARAMVDADGGVRHVTTGLVPLGQIGLGQAGPRDSRRGEDSMLSQVLAFDVQVYDPEAPVFLNAQSQSTVAPADAGWRFEAVRQQSQRSQVSSGAYVDLGYAVAHNEVSRRLTGTSLDLTTVPMTPFSGPPHPLSRLTDARLKRVYDTWSLHYENNGIDEDGDTLVDEGTNGFDDPGFYVDNLNAVRLGVDDTGEYETRPPYNTPLRAVQVRFRVYEPDSQQIREVTVRQHFVPE